MLLGAGKLIKDIEKELSISHLTITVHINRIIKKAGARSHAAGLAMAPAAGI
ncbi:MAG: LuxR C-terminal-related transcriptional regulator, partial [Actinomycetota bacterium]